MFLDADAAATSPEPHPWLRPHPSLGPGKADQIRMIAGIHHFLTDPAPLAPASLHPLLAQPLIELCLRIPSWLWMSGGRDVALVIGGSDGVAPDVLARADETLALSRLTLAHRLARLVLVEQLYRAFTILKGEPYHK